MKEYAKTFYTGKRWAKVSRAYMASRGYVCERCGGVGVICHHKKYLTPENIGDPSVSLNFDNLECLCQACHNEEHFGGRGRAVFASDGQLIGVKEGRELEEFREGRERIDGVLEAARALQGRGRRR